MPFGITNASTIFQGHVNKTLHLYQNVFYKAYLEDVLIYCQTLGKHFQHVPQILGLLQQAGLQVKPQKYEFYKTTTEYLRMLLTPDHLKMDPGKVSTVEQ
jgi:hypothetical protein